MNHRGKILEKVVRNSQVPITKLAEKFGCSQRHMYNLFKDENISDSDMVLYGKVLGHDFSREIPLLIDYMIIREPEEVYKTNQEYKDKYHNLLEKYVALSEELQESSSKIESLLNLKPKTKKVIKSAPTATSAPKVRRVIKKK